MKRNDESPAAYCNDVQGDQRKMLETIRALIFTVAPDAEEIIQYGMLGYPGIANLAAQKHYVSLYVNPLVLENYKNEFPGASCGKSCLRFNKPEQLDEAILSQLLKDAIKSGKGF